MIEAEKDIIVVNGPTVDIYQPKQDYLLGYFPNIVYSVQMPNGSIATSPDRFPVEKP